MQSRGGTLIRKVTENRLVRKHGTNPPTFSLCSQLLNLISRGDIPENLLALCTDGQQSKLPKWGGGAHRAGQSSPWGRRATW